MGARIHVAGLIASFTFSCLVPIAATDREGTPAKLATPSLQGLSTFEVLACRIVNVGRTPIVATIDVVNAVGEVVGSSSMPVAPGDSAVDEEDATGLPGGTGYCVFSGDFRTADVRASIELIANGQVVAIAQAR